MGADYNLAVTVRAFELLLFGPLQCPSGQYEPIGQTTQPWSALSFALMNRDTDDGINSCCFSCFAVTENAVFRASQRSKHFSTTPTPKFMPLGSFWSFGCVLQLYAWTINFGAMNISKFSYHVLCFARGLVTVSLVSGSSDYLNS